MNTQTKQPVEHASEMHKGTQAGTVNLVRLFVTDPELKRPQQPIDKDPKSNMFVANKQQFMEELVLVLERAPSMAKQPSTKADEVIGYVREQFENIQNPHRALELELARLVEAKTPPNGDFYKKRKDKSELSVAFFHRVYGRFYEAGVLYKHQLRAMDADFTHLLAQYKEAPQLPTKQDANDVALAKIGAMNDIVRLASVAVRRKSAVA